MEKKITTYQAVIDVTPLYAGVTQVRGARHLTMELARTSAAIHRAPIERAQGVNITRAYIVARQGVDYEQFVEELPVGNGCDDHRYGGVDGRAENGEGGEGADAASVL